MRHHRTFDSYTRIKRGIDGTMDKDPSVPSFYEFILSIPAVKNHAVVRHYKRGGLVFREGERGDSCYILLSGTIVAYRTSPTGQDRILQFFKPHDIYGNITLVNEAIHTMTVEAIGPITNMEIKIDYIRYLCRQNPFLLWYLYEDLAKKLRHVSQIVEDTFLTAEQRIIDGMINLSIQFGYKVPDGVEIRLDLTQEDLARYSGTTRVTVAKVVASLVERGMLRTRPKPWVILQMDELVKRATD